LLLQVRVPFWGGVVTTNLTPSDRLIASAFSQIVERTSQPADGRFNETILSGTAVGGARSCANAGATAK
jgi:hypothetical protein